MPVLWNRDTSVHLPQCNSMPAQATTHTHTHTHTHTQTCTKDPNSVEGCKEKSLLGAHVGLSIAVVKERLSERVGIWGLGFGVWGMKLEAWKWV
jgi:hypothetical protein